MPAITSTGIYPGTSNLMAAHMISEARQVRGVVVTCTCTARLHPSVLAAMRDDVARVVGPVFTLPFWRGPPWGVPLQEYNPDGTLRERPGEGAVQPARLRYSYYTAGSGGVGPTILETSMLLAGEEVVAYRDGQKASQGLGFQLSS